MVVIKKYSTNTSYDAEDRYLLTHQRSVWQQLTPRERLRRSWVLRNRLINIRGIHDTKLFPHT
ncbi:MAG: hypothetical protein WC955_11250 [Elusimicrobiota bacterium]